MDEHDTFVKLASPDERAAVAMVLAGANELLRASIARGATLEQFAYAWLEYIDGLGFLEFAKRGMN